MRNGKQHQQTGTSHPISSSSLSVVNCSIETSSTNKKNQDTCNSSDKEKSATTSSSVSNKSTQDSSVSFPSEHRLDFIGTSHAVKDLFSLPYSSKEINVAVHNLNGTLLIDAVVPNEQQLQQGSATHVIPPPSSKKRRKHQPNKNHPRHNVTASIETAPEGTERKKTEIHEKQKDDARAGIELPANVPTTETMGRSLVSLSPKNSVPQQSDALAVLNSMIQEQQNDYGKTATRLEQSSVQDLKGKQEQQQQEEEQEQQQQQQQQPRKTSQLSRHVHSLISRLDENYDPEYNGSGTGTNNSPRHLSQQAHPEPREYLQWKFHDMNLLVGSNMRIYRGQPSNNNDSTTGCAGQQQQHPSVTIRVEEASEMRDQLKRHEHMVRTGQFVPDQKKSKWQQLGKPSYAEALQTAPAVPKPQILEEADPVDQQKENPFGSQQQAEKQEKDRKLSSFSVPDLDRVQLQTCIVPSSNSPLGGLLPGGTGAKNLSQQTAVADTLPSPTCTVLDAYLDNIMANVPQLALCLREKGFVQSLKLLRTHEIPSGFMKATTLDTSTPFDVISNQGTCTEDENIFSPQIMEMNASTLLRFLKANCSVDNATYLFRREAGQTNIQLYDISSISTQRQRKWIWWLAMMSYRFALRLRHLAMNVNATFEQQQRPQGGGSTAALKRSFRARQRSLLQNTLNLLEELTDMDGGNHETLVAEVCEKLADTFLSTEQGGGSANGSEVDANETTTDFTPVKGSKRTPSSPLGTVTTSTSQQPYSSITIDALNKAQDHIGKGIDVLWKVWEKTVHEEKEAASKSHRRKKRNSLLRSQKTVVSIVSSDSSNSSGSSEDDDDDDDDSMASNSLISLKTEAITTQLYGLHDKLINVSLRLAEHHLNNYFSSSAMQSLRTAARRMADTINLLRPWAEYKNGQDRELVQRIRNLQFQYTGLWEHCGHFARSFAADELWRDRGHACGDDVLSVLCDVEAAFRANDNDSPSSPFHYFRAAVDPLSEKTNGIVTLRSLTAIVSPSTDGLTSSSEKNISPQSVSTAREEGLKAAKALLEGKRQLQRDKWHVLVASCISYSRAIRSFQDTCGDDTDPDAESTLVNLLRQRLGDACNETGKVLLTELRSLLVSLPRETGDTTAELEQAAEPLLRSAEFWFLEGLKSFEACKDLRNIALLRCNLCQCYKLLANSNFATKETISTMTAAATTTATLSGEGTSHAEVCLQEAASHLQAAHEVLGERDVDPFTWDMVSEELAATFLVLGVRRRQSVLGGGNAPVILQVLRLSPGKEKSIVDPMQKALKIYEQSGNFHQAAAVHYQLALFYSKVWTCQRDETKTREKLSSAFQHYNASHSYFATSLRGNEPTFVLLSLDLSSLYAAVSGEECLTKALLGCLGTLDAFSIEAIDAACQNQQPDKKKEWLGKMETLASSVEDRVFKLLRGLVKEESSNNTSTVGNTNKSSGKFKEIYRTALTVKMGANKGGSVDNESTHDNAVRKLLALHEIMCVIKDHVEQVCQC